MNNRFLSCALLVSLGIVAPTLADDLSTTNQNYLQRFFTAVEQKQRPVTILSFGDSMADSYRSIGFCLMDQCVGKLGVAGYSLDNYRNNTMINLSGGAQWLAPNSYWYGYHVQVPAGEAAWSVTQLNTNGVYCDSLTLFYVAYPGGGDFNLLIATNGGPWATFPLNGYAPTPRGCFTNVLLNLNYYKFRVESLSGSNLLIGPRFLNTRSTGVNVAFSYYPGLPLAAVTNVPLSIRTPIFAELAPDLLLWHMKEPISEWTRRGLIECEQWWAQAAPNCDVVYLGTPWASVDTNSNNTLGQNTIVRSVAQAYRRAYVDCMTPAVSYSWLVSQGYMADETHLNYQGSLYLERFVWTDLGFFAMGTPHSLAIQQNPDSVNLQFSTVSGISYTVESSPDYVSWQPLFTVSGDGSQRTQVVPASSPRQFFRLHLKPN